MSWEYHTETTFLNDIQLAALGSAGWELVSVSNMVTAATSFLNTGVDMSTHQYVGPPLGQAQGAFGGISTSNINWYYVFKRPLP